MVTKKEAVKRERQIIYLKNVIILLLFILLLQNAYSVTLKKGEATNVSSKEIKIIGIQENKIVVSVDGVKNIVELNEEKEINNLKINLISIFYVDDEDSTATIEIGLTYSCGDGKCDSEEKDCCSDCGCSIGKCISDKCVVPECEKDIDCDDENNLTEDSCTEYSCEHNKAKCKKDYDCNDFNIDTDDKCSNGKCKNTLNYICKTDKDCDDNDPCTINSCVNKDCKKEEVKDCKEAKKVENNEEVSQEAKKGFFNKLVIWFAGLFN